MKVLCSSASIRWFISTFEGIKNHKLISMNFQTKAEEILGRNLKPSEGIEISQIQAQEKILNTRIPAELSSFYTTLGNSELFTDGFQHFAKIEELLIKDNKLIFLEENQSVVYWAVDLDDHKTIYQTTDQDFEEQVIWSKEEFELEKFLEMMLYFQCVMADESFHQQSKSGFVHYLSLDNEVYDLNTNTKDFIDNLGENFKEVVKGNGLSIYWNTDSIITYFLDSEGNINDMVFACTKNEKFSIQLIEDYEFNEF